MLWVSYGKMTNESIKGLVLNPQNRAEAVAKLVDAYGGEMVSYHMSGVSALTRRTAKFVPTYYNGSILANKLFCWWSCQITEFYLYDRRLFGRFEITLNLVSGFVVPP